MFDEDFVMGYACGYNDGIGSGGGGSGGGTVIPEGTATIYDIPILHNYTFDGTDFGLGIIDINNCPFLNKFSSGCKWYPGGNMKTKEKFLLPYDNPSVQRNIAVAITKNNAVIGVAQLSQFDFLKTKTSYYALVDGSPRKAHGDIVTCTVNNQQITTSISEGSTSKLLFIYLEYDLVTTVEQYKTDTSNAKQGTADDGLMYLYYDEDDIDVYQGTTTSTNHQKIKIANNLIMNTSDNYLVYPEGLRNIYQMNTFNPNVIWGTSIENIRDFHLGLTTGLSG